jgi:hypothetical protein
VFDAFERIVSVALHAMRCTCSMSVCVCVCDTKRTKLA